MDSYLAHSGLNSISAQPFTTVHSELFLICEAFPAFLSILTTELCVLIVCDVSQSESPFMLCTLTFLQRQSTLSVWLPVPIVTFKFYLDSLIIVWVCNACARMSMEVHIMAHFWMSEDYNWMSVLSCHCGIQGLNKGRQVGSRWFYTESSSWPRNPIFELKIRGEIKAKDFSSFWNYQCKKLC